MAEARANENSARRAARSLLHPAALMLIAGNLIPAFGILAWGWDAFLLLMLYWMETAVIGFWTMVRIALAPTLEGIKVGAGTGAVTSRAAIIAFFAAHSGLFMLVHFLFLWALFSGDWSGRVGSPGEFVRLVVLASGLWLPLAVVFVARGLAALRDRLEPAAARTLGRWFGRPVRTTPAATEEPAWVLLGFYGRIVLMQATIILGAFLALIAGSMAPLLILIAIKTAADLYFYRYGQ